MFCKLFLFSLIFCSNLHLIALTLENFWLVLLDVVSGNVDWSVDGPGVGVLVEVDGGG